MYAKTFLTLGVSIIEGGVEKLHLKEISSLKKSESAIYIFTVCACYKGDRLEGSL